MADVKIEYGTPVDLTIGLATGPLASDTNLLAGRASTAFDNSSDKMIDALIGVKITAGTTPTVSKSIEVFLYGRINDTPEYPDAITGTDANKTITSLNVKASALIPLITFIVDATTARSYTYLGSVAQAFGGILPKSFGVFVVHDTAVALHATAGNHKITVTPVYATVL